MEANKLRTSFTKDNTNIIKTQKQSVLLPSIKGLLNKAEFIIMSYCSNLLFYRLEGVEGHSDRPW